MANWFQQLFGVREGPSVAATRASFSFNPHQQRLTSLANGRNFAVGAFTTPSLEQLRVRGLQTLQVSEAKGFRFENIVHGDVLTLHYEHPGAIFQAASQFNCLEFSNPRVTPEDGITNYFSDRTQGPACALACAAGTVVRNYFAFVDCIPPAPADSDDLASEGRKCEQYTAQTWDRQINNLDALASALGNEEHNYFEIRNGYCFSDHEQSLIQLGHAIRSFSASSSFKDVCHTDNIEQDHRRLAGYDELLGLVKVGLHRDVGVTFSKRWTEVPQGEDVLVTQCYCSALSCAYSGIRNEYWEPFAQLVLDANYEATLWAAIIDAVDCNIRNNSSRRRKLVFLTFIGGGVFGNESQWICKAIGRALAIAAFYDAPIDVRIGHFRQIDQEKQNMIQNEFSRWTSVVREQLDH